MSKAKCKNCKDVIESKHRHDFVTCSCYSNTEDCTGFYLDGGNDYVRVGGNYSNIIWLDPEGLEETIKQVQDTY